MFSPAGARRYTFRRQFTHNSKSVKKDTSYECADVLCVSHPGAKPGYENTDKNVIRKTNVCVCVCIYI
jgi:hypothetical protein